MYDSLTAKIVAWDDSRVRAIAALESALYETVVFGIPTNIPFLKKILSSEKFLQNQIGVNSLEKEEALKAREPILEEEFLQKTLE